MKTYILRRLSFGLILIFLATIVAFSLLKVSPGKDLALEPDPRISKEYIEQQRAWFGLDKHPVDQYLDWLGVNYLVGRGDREGLLQANLGLSMQYKQPVSAVVGPRLWATLMLNLITIALTWAVAVPLGAYAAVRQYRWQDQALSVVSYIGMSLPGFFLALLLLWLFAGYWQVLPVGGLRSLNHSELSFWGQMGDYALHMTIPVIVLTIGALAGLQRITRGNMLEVLRQQYVVTARAKGLKEGKVIFKHALRNAVNPLITIFGFQFAGLFAGAALLENVVNYPGIGQLMLEALRSKDQAVVMAVFLLGAVMLVLGNLLGELLLALVDPRVAYG